jgi:hypothetical protein
LHFIHTNKISNGHAGINGDRHKIARQSAAASDTSPKKVMVEEQSFVSGLSVYLSGLHADRIERSAKGEDCEIELVFRP